jgi:hypothetical protein
MAELGSERDCQISDPKQVPIYIVFIWNFILLKINEKNINIQQIGRISFKKTKKTTVINLLERKKFYENEW